MLESMYASANYQASKALLDLTAQRHQALTGNLANVDTPGYRRKDVDPSFRAELEKSLQAGDVEAIRRTGTPEIREEGGGKATRPDGNNVSLDRELMLINQNALEYEALTQFVSSSLDRMKLAITGRNSG